MTLGRRCRRPAETPRVFLAVLVCLPVLLLLLVVARIPLTRIPRAALLRETTRRGLSTLAVRDGLLAVGLSWLGWICH